jgi:hypothetical protein
MNPLRQEGPCPEALAELNAKRLAHGLAEIPSDLFEEKGLTIDELPEGENPWRDPHYITQIALPDNETGQVFYFKVTRINAPNYHNLDIYALGLLNGLRGKALMTVWTLWEKLLERRMFEETEDEEHRRSMSDNTHKLARLREVVKAIIQRLQEVKADFTEPRDLILLLGGLENAFTKAIDSLHGLARQAAEGLTVAEMDLLSKRLCRAEWISDRPTIAYAVDRIFRKHSDPRLKVADILRRIAKFENTFLRANVDDSGGSVAREISRFKEDPERVRIVNGLIDELLGSDWYTWPPDAPHGSDPWAQSLRGNGSAEDQSQSGRN